MKQCVCYIRESQVIDSYKKIINWKPKAFSTKKLFYCIFKSSPCILAILSENLLSTSEIDQVKVIHECTSRLIQKI